MSPESPRIPGHRKTLFDEQLLVPFILRLPGVIPAGKRLPMQVRMIDVLPTILDAAGLDIPLTGTMDAEPEKALAVVDQWLAR